MVAGMGLYWQEKNVTHKTCDPISQSHSTLRKVEFWVWGASEIIVTVDIQLGTIAFIFKVVVWLLG